jgi:hypothetical protein
VKIIFSNNELVGSRWIRQLSSDGDISEIPSHVSFLFFDSFVLESAFPKGFRINQYDYFKAHNKIVMCFEYQTHFIDELKEMKKISKIYYGSKYDWKSVLYQGIKILFKKWFGMGLTLENKWDVASRVSCQEIMRDIFPDRNLEMMTPYDLMLILEQSKRFKKVNKNG